MCLRYVASGLLSVCCLWSFGAPLLKNNQLHSGVGFTIGWNNTYYLLDGRTWDSSLSNGLFSSLRLLFSLDNFLECVWFLCLLWASLTAHHLESTMKHNLDGSVYQGSLRWCFHCDIGICSTTVKAVPWHLFDRKGWAAGSVAWCNALLILKCHQRFCWNGFSSSFVLDLAGIWIFPSTAFLLVMSIRELVGSSLSC